MSRLMYLRISDSCPDSENSDKFHQGMVDRMAVSYHKYGAVRDGHGKVDWVDTLRLRLDKYILTGNTEHLMDVANYAMIEFMHKGEEAYTPTDSSGSPGRVWVKEMFDEEAEVSQRANDGTPQ